MKRYAKTVGALLLTFLVSLSNFVAPVPAQVNEPSATVAGIDGCVEVRHYGSDRFVALAEGKTVGAGDLIETGTEGKVRLSLPDGSTIVIGPSSRVFVRELGFVEVTRVSTSIFSLIRGKIRADVAPLMKKESRLFIETTNATVGVRGTDFGETFDPDTETTYLLAIEDCVTLSLSRFVGSVPFVVCAGNSMTVTGGGAPAPPSEEAPGQINRFLRDMSLGWGGGKPGTGEGSPPHVTAVFLDRSINLAEIDGSVTVTRDDLSVDGTLVVGGTAADDSGAVSLVEVSVDGGAAWKKAAGTGRWSFSFTPEEGIEYLLMVRATNDRGIVSDLNDVGPWTIAYRDVGYEKIVRSFIDGLIGALRTGDISTIREIVSDGYDGDVGGYFSKDEMIQDGVEDLIGTPGGVTITYTLDRVSSSGDRIVGVTRWVVDAGGTHDQGTTTWWLSKSDDFRLVRARGKWLLASLESAPVSEPKLVMTIFDNGSPFPDCSDSVRILLTVPSVPSRISDVTVNLATRCEGRSLSLDRAYYESYTGRADGFGGEAILESSLMSGCMAPTCAGFILVDMSPNNVVSCGYADYGYNLSETIVVP